LVDENNDLNIIDTSVFSGGSNLYFTAPMTAPSVHVFKIFRETITGIEINGNVPESYNLYQNYPNPFNSTTKLRFEISELRFVSLKIFDILGREVATLVNEQLKPGSYESEWDAAGFTSGVYFYKLETTDFSETKKIILIK